MSQTRIESEFKFTAPADLSIERIDDLLTGLRIRCRLADSSTHQDVYLDDDRQTLSRHGVGLRLRRSRRGSFLCCKDERERKGAMFVRDELELPWNGEAPGTAQELPEPLRDLVEPFVLRRRLAPLVTLEVQRDHRELAAGEHDLGELLYDRVVSRADDREAAFAEIELEVRDDLPACETLADRLQGTFGLQAATADKPSHAAHLLGIARAPAAPVPVDRSFRAMVVAHAEPHLAAIRHAWAGVRSDRDTESVHRLRVGLRRLRALARAAEDVWLPEEAALVLRTLRDFGRALGPLRESDVMLLHVPDWLHGVPGPLLQARDAFLQRLQQARSEARHQAMAVLRSPAHLDSWTVLESKFTATAMVGPAAELAADTAAAEQLERASRQVRRLAQKTKAHDDLPDLHELRLALKRMRYLAEEFGAGTGKAIEVLARAQDRLGAVCDHEATIRRLLALLAPVPGPVPAAAGSRDADQATLCALVGALAALEAAAERKARKRLEAVLDRLDRKSLWKSFAAAPTW